MAETTKPPRESAAPLARAQVTKGTLAVTVGLACAAICAPFVDGWESGGKERLVAYHGKLDPPGIWTICGGDTLGVRPGDRDTSEGCKLRLDRRLADHARPVLACTPGLRGHDNQLAAALSLAYNIGTAGYCRSTVARRFNAGQWRAACDAMLAWNKAGGRVAAGLTRRRTAERQLCLKGLAA